MGLYQHTVVAIELLVPLDRAEIGGGEEDGHAERGVYKDCMVRSCRQPFQKGSSGSWL